MSVYHINGYLDEEPVRLDWPEQVNGALVRTVRTLDALEIYIGLLEKRIEKLERPWWRRW
jgi:hypothetical protein